MRWTTGRMLTWFAGVLIGALNTTVAAEVRTVALSGQQPPGAPSGVIFNVFTEPVLNADGEAAFWAVVAGNGVTNMNNEGIWSEGSGTLELVARDGDQAPGTPSGDTFNGFLGFTVSEPIPARLSATGQTAFSAYLDGSSIGGTATDRGIWVGDAGDLRLVARQGSQAPDTPSGVNFNFFNPPVLNAAGQTAFLSQLTGSGVDSFNDNGIWTERSGNLVLVARDGQHAPGTPSGVYFWNVAHLALNGVGETAFWARLTGSGVDNTNNQGIWAERSGGLDLVARTGELAPGTPSGVRYSELGRTAFNDAGQTAFLAWLTGSGVDADNATGIWSEGAGSLSLIAREGSPAPGTPNGVYFNGQEDVNEPNDLVPAFSALALNSAGRTAFLARLGGAGVDDTNGGGVWSESSGSLELVARMGSHAPGTPEGVNFTNVSGLSMNAAGQTAFQGRAGVDSLGDSGIWATDVNGTLQLVVRAGDTLEVAPADFRTIWYVDFVADSQGETGNEDGRASGFNDRGQIAFEAHFTDGTSGIFVSDAVLNDGVLPGDFNRDGVVDGADYVAWRKIDGENPAGYNIWRANLGRTSDGTDLASTAPEASSLLLIVLGVSAVASVHRSRRAS